ncbi:MAG TPA: HPF/RaiA family ribosome-associated protein [Gammaproteobacteria bacterium]|nr:HPF/RaiA family ribosome-associated protein [Gammaproteobacteria bacterium]
MKLTIRSRGVRLTHALDIFVRARVRAALGQFGRQVRSVVVALRDAARGRHPGHRACVIRVEFDRGRSLVVRRRHSDLYAAVALAAARAGMSARLPPPADA